jgi:hypothetical protein
MCLDIKNAYETYPSTERSVDIKKARVKRDMNNNALFSSDYLKLVCDFKSILKYNYNSKEK